MCANAIFIGCQSASIADVIETALERISIDKQWEMRRSKAAEYLASIRERSDFVGLRIHIEVEMGPVAETILNRAESRSIDLIVMTTHGRSSVRRWV